jgi:putative transferase (TIGR04331 family)
MIKHKKYLIFTSINSLIPKDKNNKIIYCSENAITNLSSKYFDGKKNFINKSIWNNKNNLVGNYKYICSLSEKITAHLANKLNKIHKKNFSVRFWNILIGVYVDTFVTTFFDKWYAVKNCIKLNKIDYINFIKIKNSQLLAYEMYDYGELLNNDYWHQKIYQNIGTSFFKKKQIKLIKEKIFFYHTKSNLSFSKKLLFLIFNKFFLVKYYKYFIVLTYTGFWNEFILSIKLRQLPLIFDNLFNLFYFKKKLNLCKNKINNNLREFIKKDFLYKNSFEENLFKNLILEMPSIFIENFNDFEKSNKIMNFPTTTKKIFLSNGLGFSSLISFYVATQVENCSKLIIGQHGGSYGTSKFNITERNEKKISNKFLTWGWSDSKNSNKTIKAFFFLKKMKTKNKNLNNIRISLILAPRFCHLQSIDSCHGSTSYFNYFNFLESYLFKISEQFRSNIYVKFPNSHILDIEKLDINSRIKKYFKFYKKESFSEVCDSSDLLIHTANSTSMLEALHSNIPSLILLDEKQNLIRNSAKKYFKLLNKNKILHYNTTEAAKFTQKLLINGINKWWFNEEVQQSVNLFCDIYARRCDQKTSFLKNIILS